MVKVFIDGSAGTTGLKIADRLAGREDLALITLPEELRKDSGARRDAIHSADVVFLCLPDAAAVEAVALAEGAKAVLIDTSTAHRTAPGWAYGFPELTGRRDAVLNSGRIANPGCHASGFLALTEPLVTAKLLSPDAALTCFSLTGYSGGGKKMIAGYEAPDRDPLLGAPRQYGLTQSHKHLPEMTKISGLRTAPAFCPIVGDFYSGMEVTVPLFTKDLRGSVEDVRSVYRERYTGKIVHFDGNENEDGFLSAGAWSGYDDMQITVQGEGERILLVSRFDNLGKGASGSAIQNMNLVLGFCEDEGLKLKGTAKSGPVL